MALKEKEIINALLEEIEECDLIISKRLNDRFNCALEFNKIIPDNIIAPSVYLDNDFCFCFDFIEKGKYLSISLEVNRGFHWAKVTSGLSKSGKSNTGGSGNLNEEFDIALIKSLLKDF